MTTPEAEESRFLVLLAVVAAIMAEGWLRGRMMLVTAGLSLAAMIGALTVGTAPWAAMAALAIGGALLAFFGPLLRPWGPGRTWLVMIAAAAFDLVLMGILGPPCAGCGYGVDILFQW